MARKLGTLLDRYFKARNARLAADKEAARLKRKEAEAQEALRAAMNAEKTEAASGPLGKVSLKLVQVPKVVDWDAFYAFVLRRKVPHLMQRRLHEGNVDELLQHDPALRKQGIAGVEFENVQKMSASGAR